MNEISIIINGVRYDAVETTEDFSCESCDLHDHCIELGGATQGANYTICILEIGDKKHFKKFVENLD